MGPSEQLREAAEMAAHFRELCASVLPYSSGPRDAIANVILAVEALGDLVEAALQNQIDLDRRMSMIEQAQGSPVRVEAAIW